MATLADQLQEARGAYHDLQIGKAVVTLRDQNGEEVTYSRASVDRLAAYIRALESQVAGANPRPSIVRFQTSKGL